jgi:hypothetical protein
VGEVIVKLHLRNLRRVIQPKIAGQKFFAVVSVVMDLIARPAVVRVIARECSGLPAPILTR